MKFLPFLAIFLLAGCEDEKARAEEARQEALQREVEARLQTRPPAVAEESLSAIRVFVYGITAVGGLAALFLLGGPHGSPGDPAGPDPRPPRAPGPRVLDTHRHENPPRH